MSAPHLVRAWTRNCASECELAAVSTAEWMGIDDESDQVP